MIVGIDGNEANVEKRVGISEYAYELLVHFERFKIYDLRFLIYLKDKPSGDLPKERDGWKYRVIGPKKLWTQFALPLDLYFHKPRPSVFFSPTHYAPRFSPVPTVISIMDISYIYYPEMFKASDLYQLRNWTAYSARSAAKIFTISKASKGDIIRTYNVLENKVVVTYPGIKSEIRNMKFETNSKFSAKGGPAFGRKMQSSKLLKDKYGIDGDYILFVGTLQPRKNLVRLIEAFSLLCHPERSEGSLDSSARPQNDIQLVIVGKKGWMYEDILNAPKKFGVENNVKFLDFVLDDDLPLLYKNAKCFVLPSLYEGFGLPVLEAMQYGCPVITSNVSSLPEAGGDAALYVDPKSVDSIVKALESVLFNHKIRSELIEKGYKQVKKFSWEKTAKETLEVLEEVARDSK